MSDAEAPVASWTDSHCHLQDYDDLEEIYARARGACVERVVCIGTGVASSRRAVALAQATAAATGHARVWATVGLHPHDADKGVDELVAAARELAGPTDGDRPAGSVVAIGECGLDYHYDQSPRTTQKESFSRQIALAHELGLALVVHTREAWEDTFEVLAAEGVPPRTVIHCFTGGPEEARRCLDIGAYLSFSGIVTFKNAPEVREAVALCPLDRLLVETDGPYLAPVPHRGSQNEPAYVALVGDAVAALKGLPPTDVAHRTTANAATVFRLAG